jgi:hypothetical protein
MSDELRAELVRETHTDTQPMPGSVWGSPDHAIAWRNVWGSTRRSVTFAEFGFADERVKLTDWYIWVRDTGAADITARLSIWKGHA